MHFAGTDCHKKRKIVKTTFFFRTAFIVTRFSRRLAATLVLASLMTLCFVSAVGSEDKPYQEYLVKAAFLYNFAKFIEWPETSFPGNGTEFCIYILGDDPFGHALDSIQDKYIHKKKPRIERIKTVKEMDKCHLLFISASEEERLSQILEAVKDLNLLTVSDIQGFAQKGGMIHLFTEEKKIRFEINYDAIKQANLKISSKILALAKVVYEGDS